MENVKIVEEIRKTQLTTEEITLLKQSFIIIPYQVSGFIDYSNWGPNTKFVNPANFETFKRVWTGNDACTLNWKNSLQLFQDEQTKKLKYNFKLGEFFAGLLEVNEENNIINTDESFSEYKSQQIEKRYTFRVHKTFEINDHYQFMFYKIPELSGSTLFRIESIEKEFVGNELVDYLITFKTINQELANTGRARQQNIMPNSPGQGYLEAVVEDKDWPQRIGKEQFDKLVSGVDYIHFYDRYITADFQKTLHRPVVKANIKYYGNGFPISVAFIGRPVYGKQPNDYEPQRLLFLKNFAPTNTPTLFRAQKKTQQFYYGSVNSSLLFWKEFYKAFKDYLAPINKWKYEGWLQYNYGDLLQTNVDGEFTLFGKFNELSNSDEPWIFNVVPKNIDLVNNYGCEKTINVGGNKTIWDHMFNSFWYVKQMKTLPYNKKSVLDYSWTIATSLSLLFAGPIGFLVGILIGAVGISGTIAQKRILATSENSINCLIPSDFINTMNDLYDANGGLNKIPFNSLNINNSSEDNVNEIFFDNKTVNIEFCGSLTDRFVKDKQTYSTINLEQNTLEDGTPIGKTLKINGQEILEDRNCNGYIIDEIKICSIFNGEYCVEFLDIDNNVVWNGVYQSEGKWTNSMREIWTEKSCSVFGNENVFFTEPLPYPKPIPNEDYVELETIFPTRQVLCGKVISSNKPNLFSNIEPNDWKNDWWQIGGIIRYDFLSLTKLYNGGKKSFSFKVFEYNGTIANFNDFKNKYQKMKLMFWQNAIFKKTHVIEDYWGKLTVYSDCSNDYSYEISSIEFDISQKEIDVKNTQQTFDINSSLKWRKGFFEAWATTPTKEFNYTFYNKNNELWVDIEFDLKQQDNQKISKPRTLAFYHHDMAAVKGQYYYFGLNSGGKADYRTFVCPSFHKVN